jgi:hypothetical protein
MTMKKISSQDAAALLKQAAAAIRSLETQNVQLQEKLAFRDRDDRIVKIARDMETKGLLPDMTLPEKVAHLRKAQNLEVTEEAVKLAAPQGRGFGDVVDVPGSSSHPFETFIMTGDDL